MVLPPKPPPISAGMARMSLCVDARQQARDMARTMNWPWLELQIVTLPSADADQAGVRLDVALVHGLGLEAALDDHVGLAKPASTSPSLCSSVPAMLEGLSVRT